MACDIVNFFNQNITWLFHLAAASSVLFVAANAVFNPFAKDNAKLKRATEMLSQDRFVPNDCSLLPPCYCYAMQVFFASRGRYASQIVKFCPVRRVNYLLFLPCIFVCVCLVLSACAVVVGGAQNIVNGGISVGLFFVLCVFVQRDNYVKQKRTARKIFQRFVEQADLSFGNEGQEGKLFDDMPDQLEYALKLLDKHGTRQNAATLISKALPVEKLNRPRSAEQQRRLNEALNRLICSYSK